MPSYNQNYYFALGVVLFLTVSRLSVYTTIAAGWSSNRKYALLGALRRIAQTISYEVSISLLLLSALVILAALNPFKILSHSLIPIFVPLAPIAIT